MKITKERVLEITGSKQSLATLKGVKFAYAVAKNMKGLEAEVEALKEASYKSEKMEAYNKEYTEILEAEAKRDEAGNIIAVGNGQVAIKSQSDFKKKIKSLDEKYAEELAAKKAADEKFTELLKEEFEFDFYQVEESELPADISVEQMSVIFEMVKM